MKKFLIIFCILLFVVVIGYAVNIEIVTASYPLDKVDESVSLLLKDTEVINSFCVKSDYRENYFFHLPYRFYAKYIFYEVKYSDIDKKTFNECFLDFSESETPSKYRTYDIEKHGIPGQEYIDKAASKKKYNWLNDIDIKGPCYVCPCVFELPIKRSVYLYIIVDEKNDKAFIVLNQE